MLARWTVRGGFAPTDTGTGSTTRIPTTDSDGSESDSDRLKKLEPSHGLVFQVKTSPSLFLRADVSDRPRVLQRRCEMQSHQTCDPQPTDPPFLFVMLLSARKAGDRMLES